MIVDLCSDSDSDTSENGECVHNMSSVSKVSQSADLPNIISDVLSNGFGDTFVMGAKNMNSSKEVNVPEVPVTSSNQLNNVTASIAEKKRTKQNGLSTFCNKMKKSQKYVKYSSCKDKSSINLSVGDSAEALSVNNGFDDIDSNEINKVVRTLSSAGAHDNGKNSASSSQFKISAKSSKFRPHDIKDKKTTASSSCYSEISIVTDCSFLCHKYLENLLQNFAIENSCFTSTSTRSTENDGIMSQLLPSNHKGSSKKGIKDLEHLQASIEKNKLNALQDKRLFKLYIDSNRTHHHIEGLCFWTHRRVDLGGSCGLGRTNSTLFPFMAVIFDPRKFIELCLAGDSSNGEFQNLKDEMFVIRKRLLLLFDSGLNNSNGRDGDSSSGVKRCRLSLIIENLQVAAISYLQSSSLGPSQHPTTGDIQVEYKYLILTKACNTQL